jgi:hypothetical protein
VAARNDALHDDPGAYRGRLGGIGPVDDHATPLMSKDHWSVNVGGIDVTVDDLEISSAHADDDGSDQDRSGHLNGTGILL